MNSCNPYPVDMSDCPIPSGMTGTLLLIVLVVILGGLVLYLSDARKPR